MKTELPEIAVIIPALNERANLEYLLPSLKDVIRGLNLRAEIIVADGGSQDGTREVAEQHGASVVIQQERGYGGALLAGFAASSAPYIITMDADLSHRPVFIQSFWGQRDAAEMLIASRYVEGGRADMGLFRRVLSLILNRTYSLALSLPLRDLSSGFRMYHRDALKWEDLEARDFDVLEEILVRIHTRGCRIREVPFHYMARSSGKSHAKLFKFGLAFSKTLFRMWRLRNNTTAAQAQVRDAE
ncbi:MAG TPA: glycosyltransferase [Pyrinomonadaceae bacterium]|jgi:dolichol-phosphate mannosyltransferase|nr:glycosyltransferase [Pyrinomonadaceae bacterium]